MSKLLHSFIKDMASTIASQLVNKNITNRDLVGSVGMGLNVSTEEHRAGSVGLASANDALDNALSLVLSKEEYASIGASLTEAQKAAGKLALGIAFNRQAYADGITNLRASTEDAVKIPAERMGVTDFANPSAISNAIRASLMASDADRNYTVGTGLESYDGQKINNSIYFSIAFNIACSKQDEFGEAFFPTITIDPLQSGIDVSIEYATVYNEFLRNLNGSPDKDRYNKKAVVKSVYDDEVFGANKLRVIPVYRETQNKDKFVSDLKYIDKITGSEVETAPLVFGESISLLGIGARDDMLNNGMTDNTDALDRTINLEKVYFKLGAEYFAIDMSIFEQYACFTEAKSGHWKDLDLTMSVEHSFNISKVKTTTGTVSKEFEAVAAKYQNYVVIYDLALGGQANVETSDVELNVTKFKFKKIVDANGKDVATSDAAYTEIKTVAEKAKEVGYVLEASRTNSNVRTRGILVTTDKYKNSYTVPFRSGVTALLPVNNSKGTDNASDTLANQIMLTGLFVSNAAVNKLISTSSSMAAAAQNGMLVTGYGQGVARHIIDPYYNKLSFDLGAIVDSQTSTSRIEDIRSALYNNLKVEALNMYLLSNYGVALDEYNGNTGAKPTLIIGTDPLLKSILVSDSQTFALDGTFDVHVVATKNPKMRNKMFMTFGIFDSKRNSEPNVFNFGNCVWSPTLSYDIVKTTNGSTSMELNNEPRYLHIVHLPILVEFEITDVERVFAKLPMYSKLVKPDIAPADLTAISRTRLV